jgi:hypothetical protein
MLRKPKVNIQDYPNLFIRDVLSRGLEQCYPAMTPKLRDVIEEAFKDSLQSQVNQFSPSSFLPHLTNDSGY